MVRSFENQKAVPILVEMSQQIGVVKMVNANTLSFSKYSTNKEGWKDFNLNQDKNIVGFDSIIDGESELIVIILDEENIFSGYIFKDNIWKQSFLHKAAAEDIVCFSLTSDINGNVNIFYVVSKNKGNKIYHFINEKSDSSNAYVLEEGVYDDFLILKSISDLWGSLNIFYLSIDKGVQLLKHKYRAPFSKIWSKATTLSLQDDGDIISFSLSIDKQNNLHLIKLQKNNGEFKLQYLKRTVGGWPRGGWQESKTIDLLEDYGVPVIDIVGKEQVRVNLYTDKAFLYYQLDSKEHMSREKYEKEIGSKNLMRYCSYLKGKPEYVLLDINKILPELKEDQNVIGENNDYHSTKDETQKLYNSEEENEDVFVKQAVQLMQAKVNLEENIKKKERDMARLSKQYDSKISMLKDQLASRMESFKNMESKLARQEAKYLSYQSEQKNLEKELKEIKKESNELTKKLNQKMKELSEMKLTLENKNKNNEMLTKENIELKKILSTKTKEKGIWEKIGKVFQNKS